MPNDIYKVGDSWYYDFQFKGERYKKSCFTSNRKVALQIVEDLKKKLALGLSGLTIKEGIPTLREFIETRFDPWANDEYGVAGKTKTYIGWYRTNGRVLAAYDPQDLNKNGKPRSFASKRLDTFTDENITQFKADRLRGRGYKMRYKKTSVNRTLGLLRRIFKKAVEWKVIDAGSVPKIKLLKGEGGRTRVVSPEDEIKYLSACDTLLYHVEALLFDTGMRPSECYRLRWEHITWDEARDGVLKVVKWGTLEGEEEMDDSDAEEEFTEEEGKSPAAERTLPLTKRARQVLEARWKAAGKPVEGWIFPCGTPRPTVSGHVEQSTFRKARAKAFKRNAEAAALKDERPVRYFDVYTIRHTFLTRLGTNTDVHTFMRIAGHSNMKMALKYVHPDQNNVLEAFDRFRAKHEGASY